MKTICSILLLILQKPIYCQNIDTSIQWNINLIIERDIYGNIQNKDRFIIESFFKSDFNRFIIFDYNELEREKKLTISCNKNIDLFINEINESQILIENNYGEFTTLSENNIDHYRVLGSQRFDIENYIDIVSISSSYVKRFIMTNSFPINWIKSCNENTEKIRLHYIYIKSKKFKLLSPKSYHIISNWIDINSIR